jgi:hypothetical protein
MVATLAAPSLVGPTGSITSPEPPFTWGAVTGANHYYVWVNDLTTGTSGVLQNQNVGGTSWTPTTPLHPGDTYRWWVQAIDSTNNGGAWSSSFDFTVSALAAPALIGPNGVRATATPTFTWTAVAGADHYYVWANDLTTGVSAVLQNQNVHGTSWTSTTALHAGDTYRWWVEALDSTNANGTWSSAFSFSV